jgi:DNA-binding IclR family transcriptional regulator
MLPAQPNQSLIDGLAVLQGVVARPQPPGSRELARELDLDPTRVNRLLKTLAYLGLTRQTADRKYRPGPAIHVLAAQALFASGLVRRALPHLEALHRHRLVVALGVLWRDQVSYLYHAEPDMDPAFALGRVGLFPATRSGIGLALLAARTDPEVRRLFRGRSVPGYDRLADLLDQLHRVRRQGYALVNVGPGRRSLGLALGQQPAFALALSGRIPANRLASLVGDLRQAAAAIEPSSPTPGVALS